MRWAGVIGFSKTIKTDVDVSKTIVEEKRYTGNVEKNIRRWDAGQKINSDFVINNAISVIADDYMLTNAQYMRYVSWQGALWDINNITVEYPRLRLDLGGIYNGETP